MMLQRETPASPLISWSRWLCCLLLSRCFLSFFALFAGMPSVECTPKFLCTQSRVKAARQESEHLDVEQDLSLLGGVLRQIASSMLRRCGIILPVA